MSIDVKPSKLNEKIRRKTGGLINEKFPKLDEETRRKTDYLLLCILLCRR